MLTIVFYASNGGAAKLRAREIAAAAKEDYARCYDVSIWDGNHDKCDLVEIMPDVPGWQRKRITAVYGEAEEAPEQDPEEVARLMAEANQKKLGDLPPREEIVVKKAVHRGGGRWFVMAEDEIISGPHDKTEAHRLAGEG